ncbi:flavodoxin domain-containing protein [Pseudonocardia acaciae]|uniref:flavodoxin domain-containing protein n=1 Tax=Pseudonocardia acaciae TaxID=551276 RepID=UPI00048FA269|nr:flavodoxin domain-containing protein [Pseudonocardia acaciae]
MAEVLVAYATKRGSTEEIASVIADEIGERGPRVHLRDAREVHDLLGYHAVVLGSALYNGRWQRPAVRLLRQHLAELARMRVWLFQSGPLDERVHPPTTPRAVLRLLPRIGADPPITFAGRLDAGTARGFIARKMVEHGRAGDFRDWDAIRAWAAGIADALTAVPDDRSAD